MIIRKAKLFDLDEICKLSHELLIFHQNLDNDFYSVVDDWDKIQKKYLKKCIYSKNRLILLLIDKNKIAGYLIASIDKRAPIFKIDKIGSLYEFFISDKFRGQGLGKKLLNELYKWFKKNNVYLVDTTAFIGSKETIDIYKKLGFDAKLLKMFRKILVNS